MRTTFDSPIGRLTLLGADDGSLTGVLFACDVDAGDDPGDPDALPEARAAFGRYFSGDRDAFSDLRLQFAGTRLQCAVWNALRALPYGATISYGGLAAQLQARLPELTAAPRAIGSANARTPIPIAMACHRVVGADGALTGYRGGLEVKRALLAFEASGGDPDALRAALSGVSDGQLALP